METRAQDRETCVGGTPHRATRDLGRWPGIGVRLGLIGVAGSAAILVLRQRPGAMRSRGGGMLESGNAGQGVRTRSSRAKESLQLPVRTAREESLLELLGAPHTGRPMGVPLRHAINEGPGVATIENYPSRLLWRLTKGNTYMLAGWRRAGCTNGWA